MRPLYIVLFIILFVSCEPEETTVIDEEILITDIEFYPEERYSGNDQSLPTLKLALRTSEIYPCFNYQIDFDESFKNNEMTINITGIHKPDLCLAAFGPAYGFLELPETTEKLKIERAEKTDVYEVNINSKQIEILPKNAEFTDLVNTVTFRYPENSFAVVCGTNLEQTDLCANFLEKLDDISSLSSYTFPSNGRIPYPDSSSGNWNNTPSKYFIYENESTFENVLQQFEMFVQDSLSPDDGNSIGIITWDNRTYYSYELLE